ncbi:MAG: hypothetical protein HQK76_17175 [Desulfobacterales bacterium]|nr:hypothetical protein [Desulfobacterales bacterium]
MKKIFLLGLVFYIFMGMESSLMAMGILPDTPPLIEAPKTYDYKWTEKFSIISNDGTEISGNLFTPVSDDPYEVFPAIIMPATWALPEYEYFAEAKKFCKKGYIVLAYNARGWYASKGLINVAGPKDMEDVSAVIDWICANTPVDTEKIGMCGISYGAGISLLGGAQDSRVKVIYAMSGWGDIYTALYEGETPKTTWMQLLLIDITGMMQGHLDEEVNQLSKNMFYHQNIEESLEFAKLRSPITYINNLNKRNVAVGISNDLQDNLFPLNTILPFFNKLTTKKRLDVHHGIHAFSNEVLGAAGLPTEIWNNCHAWMDENLKGVDTGIMKRPMISTDIRNEDNRLYFNNLNNETEFTEYYLGSRPSDETKYYGDLTQQQQFGQLSNTITSGLNSGLSLGIPFIGEIMDAHTQKRITADLNEVSKHKAIIYMTEAFTEDQIIVGIPKLSLTLTPSMQRGQIIAHLYTVDESGTGTLFSHAPLTLWDATTGEPIEVSIGLNFTSARVKKGHRLALAIDTHELAFYGTPTANFFDMTFTYGENTKLYIPYVK